MQDSNMDEYEFILLPNQEAISAYWPIIEPMLDRCVQNGLRIQATTNDLYQAAIQQRAFIFVAKKDNIDGPDVHMVVVTELCPYPQLPTLNLVCVAGTNLRHGLREYLPKIEGWASVLGIKAVESYVPEEIERLMSGYGFSRASVHVRKLI